MKNPFGDQQIPGSYDNLQERMYKKASAKVTDSLRRLMVQAYEEVVAEENVILSRPERNRLFVQIMGRIFDDITGPNSTASQKDP
jgi:hypothetical protein